MNVLCIWYWIDILTNAIWSIAIEALFTLACIRPNGINTFTVHLALNCSTAALIVVLNWQERKEMDF